MTVRRRRSRLVLLIACLSFQAGMVAAQRSPTDTALVRQYLHEADSIAAGDAGLLWGRSLAGPMMLVDRDTRAIMANVGDAEGRLKQAGTVFVGTLPADQNVSNTGFNWAGTHWTMVALPVPSNPVSRAALMMHERWHRIQDSLGFPASSPTNDHLDTRDGRLWLRLEGRALQRALVTRGDKRRTAASDAVLFRRYRRQVIPGADSTERGLEMNEGLAEYTGLTLAGFSDSMIARQVATLDTAASLGRSFAYYTGPAYGRLLDALGMAWRPSLSPSQDLSDLLATALYPTPTPNLTDAVQRAGAYGYDLVRQQEEARAVARTARQAELRQRFVTGPVLRLPLRDMKVGFDPNRVEPLDSVGPVYETLRVVDSWGVLDVTEGGGLIRDWQEAVVPAPKITKGKISGPGWTLDLAEGWILVPGTRQGDYTISH
ncbi:MAG TPA: hypothetical protein VFU03_05225 [Gemmatimonadales bacterium]|nr:hypothetical protein [Gemmatimonadales bacterium]